METNHAAVAQPASLDQFQVQQPQLLKQQNEISQGRIAAAANETLLETDDKKARAGGEEAESTIGDGDDAEAANVCGEVAESNTSGGDDNEASTGGGDDIESLVEDLLSKMDPLPKENDKKGIQGQVEWYIELESLMQNMLVLGRSSIKLGMIVF